MSKKELIVIWTAVGTYTVLSLAAMWESWTEWGFFSAVATNLFVTVPLAVFFAVVTALLVWTLRWHARNSPESPRRNKKPIRWQKGLFRLYMIWPLFAFGIVFFVDEWYGWTDLVIQTGVAAAAPWILHFSIKWFLRWILFPTFRWVTRGFSTGDNETETIG